MSQINFNFQEKVIALFHTALVKLIEFMWEKCAILNIMLFFLVENYSA